MEQNRLQFSDKLGTRNRILYFTWIMALRVLAVLLAVTLSCAYARKVEICGGESETLRCPQGGEIHIHSARWGRRASSTCHTYSWVKPCKMADYTDRIQSFCNGHASCKVKANGYMFGYFSCYWNEPYAEVVYTCNKKATTAAPTTVAPTEPAIRQACVAGKDMKLLHCPSGSKVLITDSYISTTQPCEQEGSGEEPEAVDCESEIYVQQYFNVICNMRRSPTCVLAINQAMFAKEGLECRGYHHYLHAQYQCRY
eukprot:TCONS_00021892-protein